MLQHALLLCFNIYNILNKECSKLTRVVLTWNNTWYRVFEENHQSEDIDGCPAHNIGQNDEEKTQSEVHVGGSERSCTPRVTDAQEQASIGANHY